MTIFLALLAAAVAVGVVISMIRLASGRTERVPRGGQRSDGQGEQLTPQDHAA
jgi:hypothetical protein